MLQRNKLNVMEIVNLHPEDFTFFNIECSQTVQMKVYDLASRFIYFTNQYNEANLINLKKYDLDFHLQQDYFSRRALRVLQIAKINTFEELINYPSIEMFKIYSCGLKSIYEHKIYIIRTILQSFKKWKVLIDNK